MNSEIEYDNGTFFVPAMLGVALMVRLCGVWHTSQSLDPVPHLFLAGLWSIQRHKAEVLITEHNL